MITQSPAYHKIRKWVYDKSGIVFGEQKTDLLNQRLSRVLTARRFENLDELADHLFSDRDARLQLEILDAVSTNHTYFFREPEVLNAFVDRILPLYQDRSEIKIWSAAASSGDEAYSLAIMIAEKLGAGSLNKLNILGTDISQKMIEKAEQGIFNMRQLDRTPKPILQKYFRRYDDENYQVTPELRRVCTFRRLNLKAQPYPFSGTFPVILCRNVFYYFDIEAQTSVANALYKCTEPGGFLMTSVTESVGNLATPWQRFEAGIYRKAP